MAGTDDKLLEAFAKILRQQRLAKGLSQEELAHRAGVSMRYISLLESRHHQPSLAAVRGLCIGLGITMTEFVQRVESELG
ncbi:helix-turn-helix domain-containing protein [Paracoccus jiaweipingae]|uniref:helix-turn-helix domain-containing protein n=1 Tax=Paracoccus sp. p2-l61 TaxID=3366950 RepID=UPI0037984467